jgi:polyisoprenoid-binding protein YceI
MRRLPAIVFLAAIACLAFLASPLGARAAEPVSPSVPPAGAYTVDVAGSSVKFEITEFLINTVSGRFRSFTGAVTVGDSLATSKIQATVDVRSVDTGVGARDGKLIGPDYFDTASFPQMQFVSTAIWGTPENFGIRGNLTIKGVTKEVVFSARIQPDGIVAAETKIDRTAFGITSGATIKNEARLRLAIRLVRAAQ